jgi:polar amino acid transport system substrate-binding protein
MHRGRHCTQRLDWRAKIVESEINRVTVGKDSAYDLFLSRELKHGQIVRALTSPTVVQTLI